MTSASASRPCVLACDSTTTWCRGWPRNSLFQGNDKSHDQPLGRLRADTAETFLADDALHAQHFGVGDAGDIAVGDLERPAIDNAVADRTSEEPVMRIDTRESIGE